MPTPFIVQPAAPGKRAKSVPYTGKVKEEESDEETKVQDLDLLDPQSKVAPPSSRGDGNSPPPRTPTQPPPPSEVIPVHNGSRRIHGSRNLSAVSGKADPSRERSRPASRWRNSLCGTVFYLTVTAMVMTAELGLAAASTWRVAVRTAELAMVGADPFNHGWTGGERVNNETCHERPVKLDVQVNFSCSAVKCDHTHRIYETPHTQGTRQKHPGSMPERRPDEHSLTETKSDIVHSKVDTVVRPIVFEAPKPKSQQFLEDLVQYQAPWPLAAVWPKDPTVLFRYQFVTDLAIPAVMAVWNYLNLYLRANTVWMELSMPPGLDAY